MRHVAFHAESVVMADPDGGCHLVGFAGRDAGKERHLLLQRAFSFDEQDVASGIDSYHVEWCGQANSRYGGIERCVLGPASVEILFARDVWAAPGGPTHLSISFRLSPDEYDRLANVLSEIFEGCDCLVVAHP